jgi:twitching motility protein PilT
MSTLSADDTRHRRDSRQQQAGDRFARAGSCDISYGLPGLARFRVNAFIQRGSCAVVMRVIPTAIPEFDSLHLPAHLGDVSNLRNGIVLVTGPTASGKSSTLAALLNRINRERDYHIITIEDPIEFLHNHKRSTIDQRELHSDTPNFALALRAALRQAPKVILSGNNVGKHRNGLEAGHGTDRAVHAEHDRRVQDGRAHCRSLCGGRTEVVRERFAKSFRFIISQRLIPRADGSGDYRC